MIRQAIIPLAGLGTRLLPLTSVYAKELLPINGKVGLEYIIEECIDAGIKEIIFRKRPRQRVGCLWPEWLHTLPICRKQRCTENLDAAFKLAMP